VEVGRRLAAPGRLGLVEAFANTHDYLGHDDDLADGRATEWLSAHGHRTAASAPELRGFRHRVRSLIDDCAAAATWLNEQIAAFEIRPSVGSDGTTISHSSGQSDFRAEIVAAIVDAIVDGTWSRMHLCANRDECGAAFFDSSRGRQGRWCSAALCGNRINSRAHRARQGARSDVA
jgi:predicted RNA-binding Zn ribbon-like protein